MSTAAISGLIGAAAATFVVSYFGNRPAEFSPRSGRRRLYYAAGLRALINIIVIGLAIATLRTITHQPDDIALHLVMGLFTLGVGGYLIIETHFSSIEFDDDAIHVSSPWRRNRVVSWDEFESIRQGVFSSGHTIHSKTSGRIYVDDVMSGSSELVERCKWQARRNHFG